MDHAQIEEIVSVLRDSCLTEMEIRQGGTTLRLRRPPAGARGVLRPHAERVSGANGVDAAAHPGPGTETEAPAEAKGDGARLSSLVAVTAALVGVFHALEPPAAEGTLVAERQVLGQIESMRLMNDCLASAAGEILAVRVEDGQVVEYGQTLFEILPEDVG